MPYTYNMESAKLQKYLISLFITQKERELINDFFKKRSMLKKGETFKRWILEAIKQEDSHENRN